MKHTLLSAAFATMLAVPALANDYMIMAPAAPGGGWDGTARAMQEVMQAEGISASVQVQNVPARVARWVWRSSPLRPQAMPAS